MMGFNSVPFNDDLNQNQNPRERFDRADELGFLYTDRRVPQTASRASPSLQTQERSGAFTAIRPHRKCRRSQQDRVASLCRLLSL